MTCTNLEECEAALIEFTGNQSQNHSGSMTTERAADMARFIGSPHKTLKIVHVAGTSGKTSTSYYVSALLQASGAKVGLTVSPHIHSLAERALINGEVVSDVDYLVYFNEYYALAKESRLALSYFEFMMVFALWVFAKERVDYAVVETGLGGLFDASNICHQPNKVCVITDIGLDHTAILGSTLYEIATQKAGIVWKANDVVSYEQSVDVTKAIHERVDSVDAKWHIARPTKYDATSNVPKFQQRNWQLAFTVFRLIAHRDNLPVIDNDQIISSQNIKIPARMEIYKVSEKTIIVDGAHNEQKMTTFFDSFRLLYPDQRPTILLSLKNNKDFESIAPIIAKHAGTVIVTEFTKEQDIPAGPQPAIVVAQDLRTVGMTDVVVESNSIKAFDKALEIQNNMVLVIGSFFLAAEITKLLKNKQLATR